MIGSVAHGRGDLKPICFQFVSQVVACKKRQSILAKWCMRLSDTRVGVAVPKYIGFEVIARSLVDASHLGFCHTERTCMRKKKTKEFGFKRTIVESASGKDAWPALLEFSERLANAVPPMEAHALRLRAMADRRLANWRKRIGHVDLVPILGLPRHARVDAGSKRRTAGRAQH